MNFYGIAISERKEEIHAISLFYLSPIGVKDMFALLTFWVAAPHRWGLTVGFFGDVSQKRQVNRPNSVFTGQ